MELSEDLMLEDAVTTLSSPSTALKADCALFCRDLVEKEQKRFWVLHLYFFASLFLSAIKGGLMQSEDAQCWEMMGRWKDSRKRWFERCWCL